MVTSSRFSLEAPRFGSNQDYTISSPDHPKNSLLKDLSKLTIDSILLDRYPRILEVVSTTWVKTGWFVCNSC